jgi:hypothetical protein
VDEDVLAEADLRASDLPQRLDEEQEKLFGERPEKTGEWRSLSPELVRLMWEPPSRRKQEPHLLSAGPLPVYELPQRAQSWNTVGTHRWSAVDFCGLPRTRRCGTTAVFAGNRGIWEIDALNS